MRKIELKPTEHSFFFCETNYYAGYQDNFGRQNFETWKDFCEAWGDYDLDLNFLVRYDILNECDEYGDEIDDEFELWLLFIGQRKGKYIPVIIHNIEEADMEGINETLSRHWKYMKEMWCEFSGEELKHGN